MAPRAKIGPKSQIISRWEGEQIVCCGHQEGRDGDDPDAQIVFYGAFVREPRSKGNNKGTRSLRSATAQTTKFSRGDTVLVQKGDRQSIGVIAQLWEVRSILTGSGDVARMRVVIHWFSKPSELPEFRPYREALKVCLQSNSSPFSSDSAPRTKFTTQSTVIANTGLMILSQAAKY